MPVSDFHLEHRMMFHVFQDRILSGLSSYAIVVNIPRTQKGGVNRREEPLARFEAF